MHEGQEAVKLALMESSELTDLVINRYLVFHAVMNDRDQYNSRPK